MLSARTEAWIEEEAHAYYGYWCNAGRAGQPYRSAPDAIAAAMRAAYRRGRADQRDGVPEPDDGLEQIEALMEGAR